MTEHERKVRFKNLLSGLVRHYGKTPTDELIRGYWRVLESLDHDLLVRCIERIYSQPPRGLPNARDLRHLARNGSGSARVAGAVDAGAMRRQREIAALRARLNGTPQPDGPPVRLVGIDRGGLTDVAELPAAACRHWLEKYEREAVDV